MDPEFWHARWENQQIGFHQDAINPHLQQFWSRLGAAPGAPVFVPLCGKSRDLLWLREQGHPVLGVELSPLAVEAFFAENNLVCETHSRGHFTEYRGDGVRILCGDFFDLAPQDLTGIDTVYDRASLIALPPAMRQRYADHMHALLPPRARVLLVTLDYPQEQMDGPPFAVTATEVDALYAAEFEVVSCCALDILAESPRFAEQGLTRLDERVYVLNRRAPVSSRSQRP